MSSREVLPDKKGRTYALFGIPLKRILIALLIVAALGVYAGFLLFGPNSLTILLGLQEQRSTFERRIKKLKKENAALQKEYFELKQLEPDQP